MSIFDILTNGSLGSALDVLANQAKSAGRTIQSQTPGGMGGLLGAGALGALFGNLASSDMVRNVALAGAGAVAWNFYRKWAASKQDQQAQTQQQDAAFRQQVDYQRHGGAVDPVAELVARAMSYAARADGSIDAVEKQRMDTVLRGMLPGQNIEAMEQAINKEQVDPNRIAVQVSSREQGEDVYRLSCAVIDPDQFMEQNYLAALAKALGIPQQRKEEIEKEAAQARRQLAASLPA